MAKNKTERPLRLEWIEAGSLAENPLNWRRHPESQMSALKDVIGDPEIGWAGACLYNQRTKRLIDGHARAKTVDPMTAIPVLIGNWSEEAERKILLTLDPLASLALPDTDSLQILTESIGDLGSPELNDLIEGLTEKDPPASNQKDSADIAETPQEKFMILLICRNEDEQTADLERLASEGRECRALIQ